MLGTTVISAKMTEMMKLFGCKEEGGGNLWAQGTTY